VNNSVENKIVQYLSGNMSEEETVLFEQELRTSAELRNLFAEYESIWKLTNQLEYDQDAAQASWSIFQKQLTPVRRIRLDWLKVAASVAILAAFTVSMWFFGSTDISFTSHDAIQKHIFVDQTEVTLNSNSSLYSDEGYGEDHRVVALQGQANFNVSKSDQAYIVKTNAGDIVVYGTQFDVYTDEIITTVDLYEGSVHFVYEDRDIALIPGERLQLIEGDVAKSTFTSKSLWADGIVCSDVPLAYILGQLRLNYNVQYDVRPRLLKEHYTVNLPKDNLEACLTILNDVVGKNFALIDGSIVLQ